MPEAWTYADFPHIKCHEGATVPEDVGDYFAWGETAPKTSYNFKNEGDYKYGIYVIWIPIMARPSTIT